MTQGKLGTNLISNVAFFGMNIVVSLWLVSYLVRQLGVAAYGMVPLAISVASYFNVITAGLNAAVGRHLTLAMSSSDNRRASIIFNSSLWASCLVGGMMCVLGLPLLSSLAHWIEVPQGLEGDAGWLFFLTVAGLAITTIGTPFQSVIYSKNRFDLQNLGNILGLLARVLVVVVLFHVSTPQLWHVGTSVLSATVVALLVVYLASRRLAPQLQASVRDFSWPVVREVSNTGGWVFISQVGTLLLVNIDLLVANKVVGADDAGKYALVLQWSLLLRNFALVIAGAFGPPMLALYADGNIDKLIAYAKRSVRFMGLLMAVPVGLVCGFSESILRIWMGDEFASLATIMILATGHLALNLAYLPLHSINMATNKVKWPGILQVVAGVVNLALAIVLARQWGLYGIAIAGGVVLLLRNLIFTPIYAAKILDRPLLTFVREALPTLIFAALVFIISWGTKTLLNPSSWLGLGLAAAMVAALSGIILWFAFLQRLEKDDLRSLLRQNCSKPDTRKRS